MRILKFNSNHTNVQGLLWSIQIVTKHFAKERIINIGPRLKQRRKEMRIKQTEMAKELGVSQTYLSNIEGGRTNCSITLFVDICNYLNVTPDYLMLGNMRGNRASIDIIDELKMCSSEEIATVKKIVDAFVLKKTEPY